MRDKRSCPELRCDNLAADDFAPLGFSFHKRQSATRIRSIASKSNSCTLCFQPHIGFSDFRFHYALASVLTKGMQNSLRGFKTASAGSLQAASYGRTTLRQNPYNARGAPAGSFVMRADASDTSGVRDLLQRDRKYDVNHFQ